MPENAERTSQDIAGMVVSTLLTKVREVKMTIRKSPNRGCESCELKNVQVVLKDEPLGQKSLKLNLRIASNHNVEVLCQILSKCSDKCPSGSVKCPSGLSDPVLKCPSGFRPKCPSGSISLEGYVMEDAELVWMPVARVAVLLGKSVKTVRRMVEDGTYVSLKRSVPSGSYRIMKLFIMADDDLLLLDQEHCRKQGMSPVHLPKERLLFHTLEKDSLFIISYKKVKAVEAKHA